MTVFIIDNNHKYLLSTNHIRVISEGSCDTEDWTDAENSALITGINYILTYFDIENNFLKLKSYFTILPYF